MDRYRGADPRYFHCCLVFLRRHWDSFLSPKNASLFRVTIPAGIAAEPAQKPSRPPANPRVLIIEPHALQRAVLVRRLSQWHYAPEAVDSGEAALQMLGVSQRKRKAVPDRFLSAFGGSADR